MKSFFFSDIPIKGTNIECASNIIIDSVLIIIFTIGRIVYGKSGIKQYT